MTAPVTRTLEAAVSLATGAPPPRFDAVPPALRRLAARAGRLVGARTTPMQARAGRAGQEGA